MNRMTDTNTRRDRDDDESSGVNSSSNFSHSFSNSSNFDFGKLLQVSARSDFYISEVDRKCGKVALLAIAVWLTLVAASYIIGYRTDCIETLSGVEHKAPLIASMLLGMSIVSSLLPLTYRWKQDGQKVSGVITAGLIVQAVALVTDFTLCTMPVPVFTDPITGARVFALRWSEWAPLAFVMTFMTEACKVDETEIDSDAYDDQNDTFQGMLDAVAVTPKNSNTNSDNNNTTVKSNSKTHYSTLRRKRKLSLPTTSTDENVDETKPLHLDSAQHQNYNAPDDGEGDVFKDHHEFCDVDISSAYNLAFCQATSTFCGWLFPHLKHIYLWTFVMILSCVLFLVIYYRLYKRHQAFKKMKLGSSITEQEMYHWARLSLGLLATCALLWTCLVVAYFIYSVGPLILTDQSYLKTRGLVMVCECTLDVVFKSIYMMLIVDVHNTIFDPNARAQRRLEELRQMMSVVWDNSSDVIGLSIKKSNGNVLTLLSPTYLKFFSDSGIIELEGSDLSIQNESLKRKSTGDLDSYGLAFELNAKYFQSNHDQPGVVGEIKPSVVYTVKFGKNESFPSVLGNESSAAHSHFGLFRKSAEALNDLVPMSELVVKAWDTNINTKMLLHDLVREHNNQMESIRCEANITRLEANALVIVVRNISERFRRFEAEKKAVSETTARSKDAAANRFTRHEVKNGLLAAIGLCDGLKELQSKSLPDTNSDESEDHSKRIIHELDKTLHEILETILAEAMARDVIHEIYEPKHERVDVAELIQSTMNSTATAESMERYPVLTEPSPLPDLAIDPQLLKYIHRNAVSNACKYGKRGGVVSTKIKWEKLSGMLHISVENEPGYHHEDILGLGNLASEIIFSPSKRLPMHSISNNNSASHSSGDGAWVMHKCAKTLGGDCDILFSQEGTTFTFSCPVIPFSETLYESSVLQEGFKLPSNMYAIAIDDSKIQRKLLARYFSFAGIPEDRIRILGSNVNEIKNFDNWAFSFILEHPDDYILFIVDENLDVHEENIATTKEGTVSGSLCVSKIRRRLLPDQERRVLMLIRSANDSANDVAIYNSRAHGHLCKAPIKPGNVLEELAPLWLARFPPLNYGVKRISSETSMQSVPHEKAMDIDARDLNESISSLQSLVMNSVDDQNIWPLIWEKLHVLKGDLLTLSDGNDTSVSGAIRIINSMRGSTIPPDLHEKWKNLKSKIKQ